MGEAIGHLHLHSHGMKFFRRDVVAALVLFGFVSLAGCGSSGGSAPTTKAPVTTVPPTTTTTTSIAQVGALIDSLYYNVSQAFGHGGTVGYEAVLAGDYPGSVDPAKFQSCFAAGNNASYSESDAPNLTTLAPDPKWVLPSATSSQPFWVAQTAPPLGTTYILQVAYSSPGGNSTGLVHVTILNGKAYFYEGPTC